MNEFVRSEVGLASVPARIFTLHDLGLSRMPTTPSGKVKKDELRQVVQNHMIKNQPVPHVSTTQRNGVSESKLKSIWSRLLGLPIDEVPLDTPIVHLADSILALQFRSIVRKELGFDVRLGSSDEMTIRSQISYINMGGTCAPPTVSSSGRIGTPTAEDMVHTMGEDDGLQRTIQAAQSVLNAMSLNWDKDVQDVFPVQDHFRPFSVKTRPNAWNLKLAMVASSEIDVPMLRHALERSFSRWPLMRALQMDYDKTTSLYLVMRPGNRQFTDRCIEPNSVEVTTAEDLRRLTLPTPSYARPPGPLVRAVIVTFKDTGAAGVMLQLHHSIFDATSLKAWQDDLHNILCGKDESHSIQQTLIKQYADAYYLYRNSHLGAASMAFHINRVRGISGLKEGLWPKQRAPQWFIGSEEGWSVSSQVAEGVPAIRTPLNPDRTLGAIGINRTISLPHINRIKTYHGIAASMVLKTACTLFNLYMTGQETILFGNIQASRAWPFLPEWITKDLSNPFDIPGPTFEAFPDITTMSDKSESVLNLMKRVDLDQSECSKWPHIPSSRMQASLGEDRAAYNECRTRQFFNWLHTWQGEDQGPERRKLHVLQSERMFNIGVLWNCGMINRTTLRMCALYDDCQMTHEEMNEATDCFLAMADWIHRPENWDRSVAECLAACSIHSTGDSPR